MSNFQGKKITLATVKAFIKASGATLHINVRSKFSGMTDGIEYNKDAAFRAVTANSTEGKAFQNIGRDNTLGIAGAWFVFGSRDHFSAYSEDGFSGIRVSNCCGHFILATRIEAQQVAA